MKKKKLIASSLLCLAFLFIAGIGWPHKNLIKPPSIKGPVLIDHLQGQSFNLQLIYSDIGLDDIKVYDVTPSQVSVNDTLYDSFTEGFITSEKNKILLDAINHYRSLQDLNAITYYYNYIETMHYDFLSLSGGLDTLYIINKATGEVTTPRFNISHATEKQYVYDITEGTDAIYILTAKSNSYDAYLYHLDKETLSLTDLKKITPSTLATNRNHYALSPDGTAYFIGDNSVLVESLNDSYSIPLAFTPNEIYFKDDQLYTLSLSELFLSYAVFNHTLEIVKTGELNLPNKRVSLVDASLNDMILYTITYDATHPLYRNYLTLYNLSTGEMIYCLALKDNNALALLGGNFNV